jgi:sarcosine oxidase subunit alpha
MNERRLPEPFGRFVDRSQRHAFTFEGRAVEALGGDTVASALMAAGVTTLSRSFKYHRRRGVLTMAGQDGNTLVQLADEPNALADLVAASEGLAVGAQNYSGSLDNDRAALLERLAPFMPVGFYYKAFYKPKGAWKLWEGVVRRFTGLGRVNVEAAHGYYDKMYLFCEVAVIGGGPAGLSAAIEAAEAGAEVMLFDDQPALGGALNYARFDAAGERAGRARDELVGAAESHPRLKIYTGAVAEAIYDDNWLAVVHGNRLYKVRAGKVVLASGALEQPMVFRNNDLPGIMLGSAAQRLMRLYAVAPGRRAVVVTANDHGYGVALDLLDAGIEVAAVADLRAAPAPTEMPASSEMTDAAAASGLRVFAGHTVFEGLGRKRVAGVRLAEITGDGECRGASFTLECDVVCVSVGYAPMAALLCHAGAKLAYDEATATLRPDRIPSDLSVAGAVGGAHDLDAVMDEGRCAGWSAAAAGGFNGRAEPELPNHRGDIGVNHPWPIFPHPKGKEFVDFDEDLVIADIENAVADGFEELELLKRYSTSGMGPSQGRQSALATVRLAARARGRPAAEMGTTTVRPPALPETFGVLAGRSFNPERLTAAHHRHVEAGARMMVAGLWWRPAFYGPPERRDECIEEEATAVRTNVGLIDVSTLGGIEVRGPDAPEFMNRMYTFAYKKQEVGRGRYALMTDPSGAIVDDGVACRFAEDHYYVTATTGGADGVYQNMLWYNAQWRLAVDISNVTAAWCGVNIAGPKSRHVLSRIAEDVDLSAEAFPYMGVRHGTVAGIPVRLLRVGFVGELGYEVHAPAAFGEALWDALMEAGKDAGIRPFGVEAQRLLRLEKGHIIIGQDTDGLTHPHEADMGWAVNAKKPFFIGKRAIEIQTQRPITRRLVGFTLADASDPLPEECHLTVRDGEIVGRVTSVVRSPALGRVIGLAYVAPNQTEIGSSFHIKGAGGRLIAAEVVPIPFYDPDNQRQDM